MLIFHCPIQLKNTIFFFNFNNELGELSFGESLTYYINYLTQWKYFINGSMLHFLF